MERLIKERIQNQIDCLNAVKESDYVSTLNEASDIIVSAVNKGNKLLIAGNGGSAADSQHFAAEIVGRFLKERKGLPAIALTTDSSILTCVSNDYSFDNVFERQIEALAKPGDVFIGFSTSGNSNNILKAVRKANELDVRTIGFLGKDGGNIKDECELALVVNENVTARVQEVHLISYHIICEIIDEKVIIG